MALALAPALFFVACTGSQPTSSDGLDRGGLDSTPDAVTIDATADTDTISTADIRIDPGSSAMPIDPRLRGTNLPAWIGPERLADPAFQAEAMASGVTLLRMPGGSWSNAYDWLGCETRDADSCFWPWAARPSDFLDFMSATGLRGSWTVSINATAQSAAALVAFFNGAVDDDTAIGPDRNGRDWSTVGTWATLRAEGGHPEPADIDLWEVGNEVYGGSPATGGDQCAEYGWEDVWTCDGTEYVFGDENHDGYLAIRQAMVDVDSTINVGAVGVGDLAGWSGWGAEVIEAAGENLDFYVVHAYGFDSSPDPVDALRRPSEMWPTAVRDVRTRLGAGVPIAVTEYNLVAVEQGDTEQSMTRAMNALFVADSIGQMARNGVAIANQWNLANGVASNGTDYGLINLDTMTRYPQFEALALWADAGPMLYGAQFDEDQLRVYPTRHDDGRWTIISINLGDTAITRSVQVVGLGDGASVTSSGIWAENLTASEMERSAPTALPVSGEIFNVELPAWSIVTVEVIADE